MGAWQRSVTAAFPLALILGTAGCGGAGNRDVETTARQFYQALEAQDGAGACRVLAPPTRTEVEQSAGRPCARAIVEEQINTASGTARTEVYGTMAQIRWTDETTFLTRYQDGWRVLAAGCALEARTSTSDTNDADDPERYECSVKN